MPRRLRIHLPGGFFHVTLRGNHQANIFFADGDRHLLSKIAARACESFDTRVHAYCWMSNHLHLLLQAGAEPIARPMGQMASEFARAMQGKLKTTGHFFERRYHATLVDVDSYLLELLRYIHLNPVRVGLVADPGLYEWSSHHVYLGARSESWVTSDFLLRMFADTRERAIAAYRQFLSAYSDESLQPEFESGGSVLGSDDFIARVQGNKVIPRARQDLESLIAEACERFEVEVERICSPVRDAYLTKVRAWIAHQASKRGIATRSAVARALGRTEATLRYAINLYPQELE